MHAEAAGSGRARRGALPGQAVEPAKWWEDPRLRDYIGLTDVALRRVLEPEGGLYLAESEKVIRRALAAGHRPRSYLMAARWLEDLEDVVAQAEAPWSKAELSEVRTELESELRRLTQELELAEQDLLELVSSSIDSQGDEADAGSFSSERQHEMTLAENSRALLVQTTTALGRIADGTYGQCEVCSEPIGKMRLQAFPRATLCMSCKSRQERR